MNHFHQTIVHIHPVFSHNRHNVSSSADCQIIKVTIKIFFFGNAVFSTERRQQFVANTATRKLLEGIFAIVAFGVEHRVSVRKFLSLVMMVAHNHIYPCRLCHRNGTQRFNTTIKRDYQLNIMFDSLTNSFFRNSVTFI